MAGTQRANTKTCWDWSQFFFRSVERFYFALSCREVRTPPPPPSSPITTSPLRQDTPCHWFISADVAVTQGGCLSSNYVSPWLFWSSSPLSPPQRVLVFRGRLFYLSTFLSTGQHSTKYLSMCRWLCVKVSTWTILYICRQYWIYCVVIFVFFFYCTWWLICTPTSPPPHHSHPSPPHILPFWLRWDNSLVEGMCSDATAVKCSVDANTGCCGCCCCCWLFLRGVPFLPEQWVDYFFIFFKHGPKWSLIHLSQLYADASCLYLNYLERWNLM